MGLLCLLFRQAHSDFQLNVSMRPLGNRSENFRSGRYTYTFSFKMHRIIFFLKKMPFKMHRIIFFL